MTSSELEVNVTSFNCKQVGKLIESKDFNTDLFDKVFSEVIINLLDTYNRFIFSVSYKKLNNLKILLKEVN